MEAFIQKLVIAQMSREDAADLIAVSGSGIDVSALREEAAVIRWNLEEMAANRAMDVISRAQMLAATERGTVRLDQIAAPIAEAARANVLASLVAASDVAAACQEMDPSRQRAVIKSPMTITLHSPGRGVRRDFDSATVAITWRHEPLPMQPLDSCKL